MTRQSNEDPAVVQGSRKSAETQEVERPGGAKGVPVNQQAGQLSLCFGTAENPDPGGPGVVVGAEVTQATPVPDAAPKPKHKKERVVSATMEEVTRHLKGAFQQVASNRGAPGPDGQSIAMVRVRLNELLPELSRSLLDGSYRPGNIRRVWIPKPGKGRRGLGIPDVVDRVVQEAVRQVLEPLYEPTFHESSHGFRPGRSCHTAIWQAQQYVEDGYEWTADLDLAKFFDKVNHQRLMSRLAKRIEDRRLLELIGHMLKAKVVLPDGVVVSTEEGVPQGGPLSPLLSNIVLDEFDQELARRGHRFVRYADDVNIYVRSERAGQRVLASVISFLERRMRLKVNESKSAVARTEERHFVGFIVKRELKDGGVEVLLSERSRERIDEKIRSLTPRSRGSSMEEIIKRLNRYLDGWIGFFGICTDEAERTFSNIDAHIRRRLRAIQLKHWKRKRTISFRLIQRGVPRRTVWRQVYGGRKSIWAMSYMPVVHRGLRNAYLTELGLVTLLERWRGIPEQVVAPAQLKLALG